MQPPQVDQRLKRVVNLPGIIPASFENQGIIKPAYAGLLTSFHKLSRKL